MKICKVMFVHLSVILFKEEATMNGQVPPGRYPPQEYTDPSTSHVKPPGRYTTTTCD